MEQNLSKTIILFMIFICLQVLNSGCATIPEGELQLGPEIKKDMRVTHNNTFLNKGRPIYVEAKSYPQILENGDIWAGGSLMMNIGREDVSFDEMLKKRSANSVHPLPIENQTQK